MVIIRFVLIDYRNKWQFSFQTCSLWLLFQYVKQNRPVLTCIISVLHYCLITFFFITAMISAFLFVSPLLWLFYAVWFLTLFRFRGLEAVISVFVVLNPPFPFSWT